MPVTTICVRPFLEEDAEDDMYDDVTEGQGHHHHGDLELVAHPAHMGYNPRTRRRCGLANVLGDLTDDQLTRLQALQQSGGQEADEDRHQVIDRTVLKSARYRTRRNAVDLTTHAHRHSLSEAPTQRVVEGEVCGGLRHVHKKPLQGNWVCG